MWLRRSAASVQTQTERSQEELSPETDVLLDAVGSILRAFARGGFTVGAVDAATTEKVFRLWAEHTQVGTPPPGVESPPKSSALLDRDWSGLQREFDKHRRAEQISVTQAMDDLREIVWALVMGINRALDDVLRGDEGLRVHLQTLSQAVSTESVEDLRKLAETSVRAMDQSLKQRTQLQAEQVKVLSLRVHDLGEKLDQARIETATDPLTLVFNRRAFDRHIEQLLQVDRWIEPTSTYLMMVDADHFKAVNDRHGHPAGDLVLKELASTLVRTCRRRGDFVARYGGEEFAILLRDLAPSDALRLCDRVLAEVRNKSMQTSNAVIKITVSMGLSRLRRDDTVHTFIQRADAALYHAKHRGRDRWCASELS